MKIKISRVAENSDDIPLPRYATEGSAGMDVCACLQADIEIQPGQTVLIPSGFVIELPQGYEAQVRPRSGLAVNHGITILNAPGTIDSDYRGEIKVILTNLGSKPFTVRRGDRIAQLIVSRYERIAWEETREVKGTMRGSGGFGHTGIVANRTE